MRKKFTKLVFATKLMLKGTQRIAYEKFYMKSGGHVPRKLIKVVRHEIRNTSHCDHVHTMEANYFETPE